MGNRRSGLSSFQVLPALQIGRVAGIPVRLDATYAIMAIAVLLSLFLRHGLTIWQFLAAYAFVMVGLTLSVLGHELGHAVVARRYRLDAVEIRIGAFFGLVELSGEAARRSDVIKILLAGPAANGIVFAVLWALMGMPALTEHLYFDAPAISTGLAEHPVLRTSLQWLALTNFGMLIFNLLPAFPLDGGRIARLLLEGFFGDGRAVRIVAALGIVIGLWSFFGLALSSAFIFVGGLLVYANASVLRGDIEPPHD